MTVNDVYRQLFGRSGTNKGSDISMSEHGRAGGVSSKQGFKYVGDVKEAIRVAVVGDITYVGRAAPGTATDVASWQIISIDESSGTVITYADGDDNYDNIWGAREELSYA